MTYIRGIALLLVFATFAAGQMTPDRPYPRARKVPLLQILDSSGVLSGLNLSPEARRRLDTLQENYYKDAARLREKPDADVKDAWRDLTSKYESARLEVLNTGQRKRLEELHLQKRIRDNGLLATLRDAEFAEPLKVTDGQKKRWEDLARSATEPLGKLLRSGQPVAKIRTDLGSLRTDLQKQLLAVLTREQRKQWDAMHGVSHDFLDRRSAYGGIPAIAYYVRVQSPALQKALRLTPDQTAELLDSEWSLPKLSDKFPPDLQRRLQQLTLQAESQAHGLASLMVYEPVVKAIQPTAEQRDKIEPLLSRTQEDADPAVIREPAEIQRADADLLSILSETQRTALVDLLGKPVGALPDPREVLRQSPVAQAWGYHRTDSVMNSLTGTIIQKELKLTDDQVRTRDLILAPVQTEIAKLYTPTPLGVRVTPDGVKKEGELRRSVDLPLLALLDGNQRARYDQLRFQSAVGTCYPYRLPLLQDPLLRPSLLPTNAELAVLERIERKAEALGKLIHAEVPPMLGLEDRWWGDFWEEVSRDVLKAFQVQQEKALSPEFRERWEKQLGPRLAGLLPSGGLRSTRPFTVT